MMQRIEVGTDVAAIGAWDESVAQSKNPLDSGLSYEDRLRADAQEGALFLVQLGGDWGGSVDVYVDAAEPPLAHLATLKLAEQSYLLKLPSGRLVVGGVEDYQSSRQRTSSAESVVTLPPSDYEVHCYVGTAHDEEPPTDDAHSRLKSLVGDVDYQYYCSINDRSTLGFLLLLLFPLGLALLPWWASLIATTVVFIGYFHLHEWWNRGNSRYQKIAAEHARLLGQTDASAAPAFAFRLTALAPGHSLKGGVLDYEVVVRS